MNVLDLGKPKNIIILLSLFFYGMLIVVFKTLVVRIWKLQRIFSLNFLSSSYRDSLYIKEAEVMSYLELKL